jgi:outer membrane protein OmpA-like peptidoglycan-associated protein
MAQKAQTAPVPSAPSPSKIDIFAGYSYLAPHGNVNGFKYNSVNAGAIGSGAYFFNKLLGAEASLASHPDGNGDGFTTINAGPIVRYPMADMTPFAHFLVGTTRIGGPNYNTFDINNNPIHMVNPYRWGTSLTAGGGLDYPLPFFQHHVSLRLFQADYQYMHASFGPPNSNPPSGNIEGGRANINAAQLSTGLVYHLGSIVPPPPITYTCSASPAEVFPGDPVTVTGTAANLNPKKTATYNWTSTGGKVGGANSTTNVDTADLAPGSYNVMGHVTEGKKAGQSADCKATFTVKPFEPPTISCTADPSTVQPGGSSTITARGVSPQNRPLTYSYSASSGQVSGSTSTATLNTTGVAPGTVTVTCNVVDDKGQNASATTSVTVNAPPVPPAPKTEALCSINFDRDKRRPVRVDNEAKACLDDVALNLQRNADAKAVLVGSSAPTEKKGETLAAERAVNTKEYLVKEKGIDPSRIDVRTGTAGTKSVQNYMVPAGANFESDEPGTTQVDTAALEAQQHAKKHHHVTKKAKKTAAKAVSSN